MRHGDRLSLEQLRAAVQEALDASGQSRTEVARALSVSQPAISRAALEAHTSRVSLQRRILEHLTPYTVTDPDVYVVVQRRPAQ